MHNHWILVDLDVSHRSMGKAFRYYDTCMLELNNQVSGWQLVEAGISLLQWEFRDEYGEKAKMIYVVMDQSWRHQYELAAAAAAVESLQSCPTLCNPIDSSPPGSAVPGILQARALEWVAILIARVGLNDSTRDSSFKTHNGYYFFGG